MAEGQLYDFLYPDRHPDWVARYRVQQRFKGTVRRGAAPAPPSPSLPTRWSSCVGSASSRPVLVIWGRQDLSRRSGRARLHECPPARDPVPVDSAGHMSHADQPDAVVAVVVSFARPEAP
jgi:pimeloyl-ACP methyl ester carboxylesterase